MKGLKEKSALPLNSNNFEGRRNKLYSVLELLKSEVKKMSVEESLYVIWAYMRFLQHNIDLPADIQTHKYFTKKDRGEHVVAMLWKLDTLIREVIAYGSIPPFRTRVSLRKHNRFALTTDLILKMEERAYTLFEAKEDVLRELWRIAHRTFPWQKGLVAVYAYRYMRIYETPEIRALIEEHLGYSVDSWHRTGLKLAQFFNENPYLTETYENGVDGVNDGDFRIILSKLTSPVQLIRESIGTTARLNGEFCYLPSVLKSSPLISINGRLYCPSLRYLIERFFDGIFYDAIGNKRFGRAFGLAFESYIESISRDFLPHLTILGEQQYHFRKQARATVDLIVLESDSALFVEIKTKRVRQIAKSKIGMSEEYMKDEQALVSAIVQLFTSIEQYKQNLYPHIEYNPEIKIFPMILTLEDWYLFQTEQNRVLSLARQVIVEKGLNPEFFDSMNFSFSSTEAYEILIQILEKRSIQEVMDKFTSPENDGHNLSQHLAVHYHGEYKELAERLKKK